MKKLFFSVCAASLLLFSACSKDDDKDVSEMSSTEISSMIVGTWQFIQEEWSWQESWQESVEKESGVDEYDEGELIWTLNKNKTWTFRYEDGDPYEQRGSWHIKDKTLIIDNDEEGGNKEFVIEKLTKDELILYYEDHYYNDLYDGYSSQRYYLKR